MIQKQLAVVSHHMRQNLMNFSLDSRLPFISDDIGDLKLRSPLQVVEVDFDATEWKGQRRFVEISLEAHVELITVNEICVVGPSKLIVSHPREDSDILSLPS